MNRRVNHRGWIVLESIPSVDGRFCVDLFEDPDGGFGFEHVRADPEDAGRWTIVGGFASTRYGSPLQAALAARSAVKWFEGGAPKRAWERWVDTLSDD